MSLAEQLLVCHYLINKSKYEGIVCYVWELLGIACKETEFR